MKVLLAGATGIVGRRVAAQLVQAPEVSEVVAAARHKPAADRLASLLGGGRVTAEELDVTDTVRFAELAASADVVLSAAGPAYRFEEQLVKASIEAGTHFVSLCDDHSVTSQVLALDDAARNAGVTIVSGCGMSPGITNLLVNVAARELDEIDEIDIAVAGSSVDSPGAATSLHFLASMHEPATAISDHAVEQRPAGTSPKLVYFPDPVGWVETFRSAHPEVVTLSRTYEGLRSLRFRVGLTERAVMDVVRASAFARLLATETQREAWLNLSQPLRPLLESMPPRGAPWTSARIDVRGRSGGRPTAVSLAVVDRLVNLAAVPAATAAIRVATEDVPRGVVPPESAFESASFLGELNRRGIRIARLEQASV